MSGISVTLGRACVGLWSDPSGQIPIPHLTGQQIAVMHAATTVQFAGDTYPTTFRGASKTQSFALTARFFHDEQDTLLDLLNLFEQARTAADSRLLLRTNAGQVAGLNDSVAVQVFGAQPTAGMGRYMDLSFTANVVEHSFAV